MTTLKTWMEEAKENEWVKVTEGIHTVEIIEAPEKDISLLTGKPQWVFKAKVDGEEGKFAPSKRLLKICALEVERAGGILPVTFQVRRIGMDTSTQYTLVRD